jgi:ubiquinone/menaquinone biosynthesis C-methylase UbiE
VLPFDLEKDFSFPFCDECFNAVTMLAVMEHIDPSRIGKILREVVRVLKPGGIFVLTTPAPWTDGLLRSLGRLKLVSPAEIGEHKAYYDRRKVYQILRESGFGKDKIRAGCFEWFMNVWATGKK